jgi:hypothetical protein
VVGAVESVGFAVTDLGILVNGSELQQAKCAFASLNLVKIE